MESETQAARTGPAIETAQLTKYYGASRGVVDLDLVVEQGEIFGFLGPNGAGKTTTIRLLLDLIRPTRGQARLLGYDSRRDSVAIKRQVGYLPGELALWDNLTARQILTYLGHLHGEVALARIEGLAERLQLDLGRKFREYSHGNKQKVGLIQAFMHQPRLLILDEPTGGLDPLNQQEFFQMAAEARAAGATIFLSSHVLSEVEHTCDRVGLIRAGQLVHVAPVHELVSEAHYHVELGLETPMAAAVAGAFAAVPGVSALTVEPAGYALRFVVQGPFDRVVKLAAHYPVRSLTSHEPTLEDAFLTYYGRTPPGTPADQEPAAVPSAPPVAKEAVHAG